MGLTVLVCGGRTYNNKETIYEVLSSIHKDKSITVLIHGAAKGVDTIAGYWARENNIKEKQYPALWNTYGKAAGSIRNQKMLDDNKVDLIVAFPGGKGTADMVERAKKANIEVREIS
jgi:predicted Rossmann-fold nucleotide-binding protein